MPIVSIIVPVFNAAKYINRCVDSILCQTVSDWELLLIDDGSTDDSLLICKEYVKSDKRIKVLHKTNGGASSARNFGIENAVGEWIVFVDSDDSVSDSYLFALLSRRLGKGSFVMLNFEENKMVGKSKISGSAMVDVYLHSNLQQLSGPYCKLFNAQIINANNIRFEEGVHMGEDAIFVLEYLCFVNEIIFDDAIGLYKYVKSTGGLHTRYYSFDSEYKCFTLWKKYLETFIQKNDPRSDVKMLSWSSRMSGAFYRSLLSITRQPQRVSYKQYKEALNSIPAQYFEFYAKYSPINGIKHSVINMVLERRLFGLYFLLMKLDQYE